MQICFASGHPLVEEIFAHYEESSIGRAVRFELTMGKEAAAKSTDWRTMVRRLGAMLDPTRRLHAVAAIEVRPIS